MKKSDETIKKILTAATEIFSENGYTLSSTKAVANKAEVSEALIFKYFKNKQSLFDAVIFKTMEAFKASSLLDIKSVISRDAPTLEIVKHLILNRITFLNQHKKVLTIIFHQGFFNDKLNMFLKDIFLVQAKEIIEQILNEGLKNNTVSSDIPFDVTVELIHNLFFELLMKSIFFNETPTIHHLESKLAIIMKGV